MSAVSRPSRLIGAVSHAPDHILARRCAALQQLDEGRCPLAQRHQFLVRDLVLLGLRARIVGAVRSKASPRHVPDAILVVPGIPRTMTGKRLEIPIKRILLGADPSDVVSPTAVDHPELLGGFAAYVTT